MHSEFEEVDARISVSSSPNSHVDASIFSLDCSHEKTSLREVSARDGSGDAVERDDGGHCAVLHRERCRKKAQRTHDDAQDLLLAAMVRPLRSWHGRSDL